MSDIEHPRITEVGRLLAENDRLRKATKTTIVDALLANGRLREERDRLREALTWVSASTMKEDAPKGEYFLIFRLGGEQLGELAIRADQIGLARYVPDDRTGWRLETNWQFKVSEPTHWAKIPTPPRAEEGVGK